MEHLKDLFILVLNVHSPPDEVGELLVYFDAKKELLKEGCSPLLGGYYIKFLLVKSKWITGRPCQFYVLMPINNSDNYFLIELLK